MNDIIKFENKEFGEIRTVVIDNEPWFVGKDVAIILGYANPSKALIDHVDEDDKLNNESLSSLGQRGGWLINESGLYGLVLSSKLPNAKKFKRWITSEVLPSIRKTGSYSVMAKPDSYMIDDPVERAKRWIEEYEERLALEQKIEDDRPLVEFANHVSDASTLIDIGALAKLAQDENIKIGRNRLFEWLRDNKYLMDNNQPYQKYIDNGVFKVREYVFNTPYGSKTGVKTYVTGKGQIYIIEKLREWYKTV